MNGNYRYVFIIFRNRNIRSADNYQENYTSSSASPDKFVSSQSVFIQLVIRLQGPGQSVATIGLTITKILMAFLSYRLNLTGKNVKNKSEVIPGEF